jgi:Domain of unknown function (DUF4372)/Transposase DDE domain
LNQVSSIFRQMMQLVPRGMFEHKVRETKAERHARGFSSWGQFLAMMFCQLGNAESLREICNGLAASEGKLKHLGVPLAPKRSTLSYANTHRPYELYEQVFHELLQRCCEEASRQKRKFRFKNPLVSFDSTTIDLCATVFDWAKYKRHKGAVKLHVQLNHDGYLPSYVLISDGKCSDIAAARTMKWAKDTIVVFDRGYVDYEWWQSLATEGVFFVTRRKKDVPLQVIEQRTPPQNRNVVSDEIVVLRSSKLADGELTLRLVTIWDEQKQEFMQFLTNNLKLGATTIAAIYRDRWHIELFFKALKQLLRVKTFVGTSANALKTQVWAALIAALLFKWVQLRSKRNWSLSNLVALIRQQLFVYRDLFELLDKDLQPPPQLAGIHDGQLEMNLAFAD